MNLTRKAMGVYAANFTPAFATLNPSPPTPNCTVNEFDGIPFTLPRIAVTMYWTLSVPLPRRRC